MKEMKLEEITGLIDLKLLPKMLKIILTMFIFNMALGYLLAILNIQMNIGMNYQSVVDHYRGNEALMIFPPEPGAIALTSHTHMSSMTMMFFLFGLPFFFTRTVPVWLKKFVIVDAFFAVIIANASFWLIRFVAAPWAVLMIISGMLLGFCAFFMVTIPLYEMWFKKK